MVFPGGGLTHTYRLFMCQDKNENEPEDDSFRSFWIKPEAQYYDTLKNRFIRHA